MFGATILLAATLITVRDSVTGFAVPAERARPDFAASEGIPVTVWLDPAEPPEELRPSAVASRLRPDMMLLHGHVSDRENGAPLGGVRVRARRSSLESQTDARGYFALSVPAISDLALPDGDDLRFETVGFKSHEISNTMLMAGADTHFVVRLERGSGTTRRDDRHKIWMHRPGGDHPHESLAFEPGPAGQDDGAPMVSVPETIRVGFGCSSSTTCSSMEVFSLETYVKRGLNDEWIASWHADSLRAGAVAYRSYGAYHVARPRTSSYDICSTTSCQVNDADTSFATDAAVDVTRGVVLVANGEIFRSEYSAELNNLLGPRSCSIVGGMACGDGFAGSPAAGWPCLPDPLCSGDSCFGHGRGMCQWGSQRWAMLQAKDWRWILNHYYNDEGRPEGLRGAFIVEPNDHLPRRRAAGR